MKTGNSIFVWVPRLYGKRLPIPLFHYSVCNTGMLISKSSKYHAQIWHYIKKKILNFINLKIF